MPYKRRGSPYYYLSPRNAGGLTLPRRSTDLTERRQAKAMEDALVELARTGWRDLVERYIAGELDLAQLYQAKVEGADALVRLRDESSTPPLTQAVEDFRPRVSDKEVRRGLDLLLALAPKDVRVAWLLSPNNVSDLYADAEAGKDHDPPRPRRANTVRRSLHRAVSDLLKREVGRGRMLALMAEVDVPSENDERNIMLSLAEVRKALAAADIQFRRVLGYVVTTGLDRSPLERQRVHDYDPDTGLLHVPDEKAPTRKRVLALRGEPVLENAEHWLRELVAGRDPDEPLVQLSYYQMRYRWNAVRKAIKRPDLRMKDLRGIFGTYYLLAGGEPRELQRIYGHATMAMVMRYLNNLPAGNRRELREQAKTLGLPDAETSTLRLVR